MKTMTESSYFPKMKGGCENGQDDLKMDTI